MIAVGLSIRFSILITSLSFSFVEDRHKGHDDVLDVTVFHKDGKAQGVFRELSDVFSRYTLHCSTSVGFMNISAFWSSSSFSMKDSLSSFLRKRISLK